MGQKSIYKCKKCGNEFESHEGGGFSFIEYRCVQCDSIKVIESNQTVSPEDYKAPPESEIGVCEKCGGKLMDDISPMCPKCKGRDVEVKEVLINYD